MTTLAGDRYVVISSDGHAGAQMHEYREYLESRYLDEFDEWAKSYVNPWDDLRGLTAYRNWDSAKRLQELEGGGFGTHVTSFRRLRTGSCYYAHKPANTRITTLSRATE